MLRSASSFNITPPTWPVAPKTAMEGRLALVITPSLYFRRSISAKLEAEFYLQHVLSGACSGKIAACNYNGKVHQNRFIIFCEEDKQTGFSKYGRNGGLSES